MKNREPYEDDGRTIADMSQLDAHPMWRPGRKQNRAPEAPQSDRPWEQDPAWTPKEKLWAVLGVLKATLMIAGVYLLGLGALLVVLFLLWH